MKSRYNVIAIGLLFVSGLLLFERINSEQYQYARFEKINMVDLQTRIDNKENMVVYYGSKECSACKIFSPILEKAADKINVIIYYIEDEENEGFADKYNLYVAPTLLLFKEGKVTRYEGSMEDKETENILIGWKGEEK